MQDDLGTIAENALNEMEQADSQNDTPPTPPEGDQPNGEGEDDTDSEDTNDNAPESGESDDVEDDETSEKDDSEEDDGSEESEDEDSDDEGDGEEDEETPPLTDEELLAEIEKRGLNKKDEKKEEERQPAKRPTEVPEQVWGEMKPWQQYVYQQLPYLEARAKDGTVLRVKTDEQVPDDFDWISEQAKNQFYHKDIPAQSVRAEKLGTDISQRAQQQQQQAQQQQEANSVVKGIEELQKSGIVPKIKAQPNTPEFNQDPGVQRANDVLKLWQEYRQRGEQISIETAGRIFKAENPDLYKPTKSPADAERKKKSRNIAGGGGRGTAGDAKKGSQAKPKAFPVGTSAADIADYYADQLD